jgi:hypothetical protein
MKTMSRTGAAVARSIALLTIAPLILSAVAPPSPGDPADPVDDVVEEEALADTDAEPEALVEAPVEPEEPVVEEEPPATMALEPETSTDEITGVVDQHCDAHTTTPKVEASGKPASADETITVDGIDVRVIVSGKTVSFVDADGNPLVVTFCVKASTATSGSQQGSSYTVDFVNPGGKVPDISYVVVYSVKLETPPAPGTLDITKQVTGQDVPPVSTSYKFAIDCGDGPSWFFLSDGASWTRTFDAGTTCTVTEVGTYDAEVSTRLGEGEWVEGTSVAVTIESDQTSRLTVRNDYTSTPDTVTIELVKQWFDVDGEPTDDPDVEWGIHLYTTRPDGSDQTVASLPGENNAAVFAFDDEGYPARYGVVESPVPQGWKTVPCEGLSDESENVVATDTSAIQAERAQDGSFPATDSGAHLVCNQQLPPVPPVVRPPRPVEPETVSLGLTKVWLDPDGEVLTERPDADFEVTLSVDGEVLASVDQDRPTDGIWLELEVDTTYVIAEPTLPAGWRTVTCPADIAADGAVSHGLGTFTVLEGQHMVCNQAEVEVAPIIIEQPDPEPTVEPIRETEPIHVTLPIPVTVPISVAEPETSELSAVRGEVVEVQLPRTGLDAMLLTLIALLLSAAGLTAVVATRRPTMRR